MQIGERVVTYRERLVDEVPKLIHECQRLFNELTLALLIIVQP
jgi:hypothetical protein